jgi:hypothetical protein
MHEPLSGDCCVGCVLYSSQHNEEFVSAYPGHCVLFTRKSLKPFCNFLQDKVADRVPERVVNGFEPVEIEEQKRNFVLLPTSTGECLG